MTRSPLARLGAALGAVAVGLVLALALSSRAGGPLVQVVTHGSSMLPGITPGTLVLLRDTGRYATGDVVGYRDPQLRQVVLHRVTGRDGERLVLRGDNNSWTDPHRPQPHEVVGERVLQVPGVGPAVAALTRPAPAGALAATAAVLLLAGGTRRRRRGAGRRTADPTPVPHPQEQHVPDHTDVWWEAVRHDAAGAPWYLHAGTWYDHDGNPEPRPAPAPASVAASPLVRSVAAGAVAAAALGGWAFAVPTTREAPAAAEAAWQAGFTYSGAATRGAAYADGAVSTGEPVFTRLVDALDVAVDLSLQVPAQATATGTWRLVTELSDDTGWRRVVSETTSQPLPAGGGSLRVRVDPQQLQALATAATRETGAGTGRYRAVVRAVADLDVVSAGATTRATAAPELAFDLDATTLRPDAASLSSTGAHPVTVTARVPGRLALGPLGVAVLTARTGALAALAGCLVLLVGAARRRDDDARRERALVARSRGLVVPLAAGVRHAPHLPVLDLESLEALLALARRYDRVVLRESVDGSTSYVLPEDGLLYRWSRPAPAPEHEPAGTSPATSWTDGAYGADGPAAAEAALPAVVPAPRRAADDAADLHP